jgi:hypothetical protein
VRSLHGSGKSTIAALTILWFSVTRDAIGADWKVPTTASVWGQLIHYLWPEIHKWTRRVRWDKVGREPFKMNAELLKLSIQLRTGLAFAMAVGDPSALEGAHADELLYVFDEARSIPDAFFDSAEGAFSTGGKKSGTNAYALAVSTPGEPVGRFYDIQSHKPGTENWWTRQVTLSDAIAAGRVTQEWVDQVGRLWGEDSALFKNRALGEFASVDADGVIPLSWVEAANARWLELYGSRLGGNGAKIDPALGTARVLGHSEVLHVIGVDVARAGGDKSVFALRQGNAIIELRRDAYTDNLEILADKVAAIQEAHGDPKAVVDADGIGSGVYDHLRVIGKPCVAFHGSGATKWRDATGEISALNVRAAAWWSLREMLDPSAELDMALPPDDRLTGDLVAARKREISGARIQIESKDDIKKRLGRSPDDGDAVVQAYWAAAGGMSWADFYAGVAAEERGEKPQHYQDAYLLGAGRCSCGKLAAECEDLTESLKAKAEEMQVYGAPPVLVPKPKPRSTGGWASVYAPPTDEERKAQGQPPSGFPGR